MHADNSLSAEDLPRGADLIRHFVVSLCRARTNTLASWREQVPALSGRTKSFENWLLVELVGLIGQEEPVAKVRTNGFVDKRLEPADRRRIQPHLRGRKRLSDTLSPDLSMETSDGFAVHCELKTGLSGVDLLDDLRIVRDYNENDATNRSSACLVWAVLLPKADDAPVLRSLARICKKADCGMLFVEIMPWLKVCVTAPGLNR